VSILTGLLGLSIALQTASRTPGRLPVVSLDGAPGQLSATPQRPAPLPPLPVTTLDERGLAAELDAPLRGVSLTFARPLPVRDVLMLLFRGTPFSIVLHPEAAGTFAGDLKDVTLRQALESVLFSAGLDYDANGTVLRVYPRRPQTRFFSVDHLSSPRAGTDFFAEIGGGLQAIVSGSGKYHVNRKASLVQVTDFADRLDLVAAYLEAAHLRVNRQVRIQARVLEVERADALPTDWDKVAARPGSGVRGVSGSAAWRVDDLDAWLRTIEQIGAVRHMGAPVLLAMNNEPAIVRADDAASELRLTVTPQIAADRIIHMHVAPGINDGRRVITPAGGAGQPFTADVDTVVRIADGDTIFISGLLRRRDTGSHAEVVVFLTVTVVGTRSAGL
jgi:type II secretory pathway component GspD/PulD (secretin)